jgi:hypothetical protein
MALLTLDLFACIVAMRIDAGPPFSALFTLWLSMMQAVGDWLLALLSLGTRRRAARDEYDQARRRTATKRSSCGLCCAAENPSEGSAIGSPY